MEAAQHKEEVRGKNTHDSVIRAFIKVINFRDNYTGWHCRKVANLMADFARYLGLSEKETQVAYLSGIVHDIGKIGIPDNILNKPAKLDKHEFDLVKLHPNVGADILAEVNEFREIAEVVRYHHERYDGEGYLHGLQGSGIPFLSRMLAVCDSYDAMTTARCYRKAVTSAKAIQEIEQGSGTQFDPELSKKFSCFMRENN
jgi:putative nucleotidyltransferase with HDIG domain